MSYNYPYPIRTYCKIKAFLLYFHWVGYDIVIHIKLSYYLVAVVIFYQVGGNMKLFSIGLSAAGPPTLNIFKLMHDMIKMMAILSRFLFVFVFLLHSMVS